MGQDELVLTLRYILLVFGHVTEGDVYIEWSLYEIMRGGGDRNRELFGCGETGSIFSKTIYCYGFSCKSMLTRFC